MPPFRDQLSDEQIAAVLSFERSHFGNTAPDVPTCQRWVVSADPVEIP